MTFFKYLANNLRVTKCIQYIKTGFLKKQLSLCVCKTISKS